MILQEFTRDIVPMVAVIVAIGGIYLVSRQLKAANDGLKQASAWNKIHATYSFFDLERSIDLEIKAKKIIREKGFSIDEEDMPHEVINSIVGDYDLETPINRFLNDIEMFACAYFAGAIDKDISYHMHSGRVVAKYRKYERYIESYRAYKKQPDALIEFEKLARQWSEMLEEERKLLQATEIVHGKNLRSKYGISESANI